MCQGGDIVCGNGLGGESVYGGEFADENFELQHDSEGILSSANMGQNTNQSQFFITLAPYESLDGENVAFGKIINVIHSFEQMPNNCVKMLFSKLHFRTICFFFEKSRCHGIPF